MSEDWKPGDLAVCVRGGVGEFSAFRLGAAQYREHRKAALVEGRTYTVRKVKMADDHLGLGLVEIDGPWRADRFRKVRPDQHEPCEEEFATLLNRSKRRVGA